MSYKDKQKQKDYMHEWFKKRYVPHPRVPMTSEARRAQKREWKRKRNENENPEQKAERLLKRRAAYHAKKLTDDSVALQSALDATADMPTTLIKYETVIE